MSLSEAHARTSDPETSHEAAASVTNLTFKQGAVFSVLRRIGRGTDYDVAVAYARLLADGVALPRQSDSGLRTRRSELVARGLVVDTGERSVLPSGRRAIVWEAP